MVQLLRIVGDVSKSNTRVDGHFNVPVKIQPNSRIALKSVRLELSDDDVNQSFIVTSTNNTFTVADGTTGSRTVTLTPSSYTAQQLLDELNARFPFEGAPSSGGCDYEVELNNNKFTFNKYNLVTTVADFNNEWQIAEGTPNLATDGTFDANASVDSVVVLSESSFGNARATFSGKLTTVGPFKVIAGAEEHFQMGVVAGNWVYGASDTIIAAANVNDTFSITKENGTVTYRVNNNPFSVTLAVTEQLSINGSYDTNKWYLTADAGATTVVENIRTQTFENTAQSTLSITFNSSQLARFLGFTQANTPYSDIGDPAKVTSPEDLKGQSVGDILVCIDPFLLDSYTADARVGANRGLNNVLYSVVKSDLNTILEIDTEYPIPLNIKNAQETNISTLNVTFRNQVNGSLLRFVDDPVLVMLVYGPGE